MRAHRSGSVVGGGGHIHCVGGGRRRLRSSSAALAVNTENDVLADAQDLGNILAPPYSSGALPTQTQDVIFRSDFTYANASSLIVTTGATGTNISMGTLNDLNATPLVISGPNGTAVPTERSRSTAAATPSRDPRAPTCCTWPAAPP